MKNLIVIGAVLLAACGNNKGEERGTCTQRYSSVEVCEINQKRDMCSSGETTFVAGEKTVDAIAHCKSLGYTRLSNVAYTPKGDQVRIGMDDGGRNIDRFDYDRAVENNYQLTFHKRQ
jgi:hypothetical protein